MIFSKKLTKRVAPLALIAIGVMSSQDAEAVLIGNPPTLPDVTTDGLAVDYSGGILSVVSAGGASFNTVTGLPHLFLGPYTLTASITPGGVLAPGGAFSIDVLAPIAGTLVPGPYLTADVTAFGFDTDVLDFEMTLTGGAAAADFGGIGATIGTIVSAAGSSSVWGADFSNIPGTGFADTFPVPVATPEFTTTIGLSLFGLLGCVGASARRFRRS